jgi:hypothetical protein
MGKYLYRPEAGIAKKALEIKYTHSGNGVSRG